jgi:chromosomal replication initiation ATPase DnaA
MLTTIRQGEGYYIRGSFGERLNPKEKYHELQKNVCKALGISIKDISSKTRKTEIVMARNICLYIGRLNGYGSNKFLANQIGLADHSATIYANRKVRDYFSYNDREFIQKWNLCKHLLKRA